MLVLEYLDRNEEHVGAYEHFYRHNSFSHNISHLPSEYFEEGKLMWKLKEVKEECETDSEIKEESFDSDDEDSYNNTERERVTQSGVQIQISMIVKKQIQIQINMMLKKQRNS